MILIIVAGCILFVIVMTIIICKCCRKKQHTTIAEKEAMFNQQNVTHEHDVEYGIQKPDPKNKSNNESMASDHPYIPPGYNEYTGGPGTAGHYKE